MTPTSDHFNGKTFFNPGERAEPDLLDLLKWKLTSKAARWPARVAVTVRPPPPAPASEGVVATWIGHSSFLIRTRSAVILTDPVFSERAGPLPWLGVRRVMAPAIALETIPRVDLVLLSHDHYDHCDIPSLRRIARRDDALVVAPLGHRRLLAGAGVRRIAELDWWQRAPCAPDIEATLVPALHWSRRMPFSTNRRLWGGFMLRAGGRLVYFAGDSGYKEGFFEAIRRRCGVPDLALIPIGAYEPRWFMKDAHMNPEEAVRVHREVGARQSVAMHWGTFRLTDEAREEPLRALGDAATGGIDFLALEPGGSTSA